MGDGGGGHWLVQMEWHSSGWLVCLPLLIFPCTIKSRSSLLAPGHPGGPRKGAEKGPENGCGVVVLWWWILQSESLHGGCSISYVRSHMADNERMKSSPVDDLNWSAPMLCA